MQGIIVILALVLAVPLGLVIFTQLMTLAASDVTSATGGASSLLGQIPNMFVYFSAAALGVALLVVVVGWMLK